MISSNAFLSQDSEASGFAVALRHVKLDFAGEEILTDIGFDVPRGSFVCLVGPSGCGKSTTLRIIGGLLEATRGQVDVDQSTPAQSWQRLAYVFQAPRLVAWRTAYENVLLGMQLRTPDLKPDVMRDRALRYLEMLGLAKEMDKFPGMLSGGQRQRVAIARALAVDPAIILMDEPFTALDYTTRRYLREQLIQIWQQTGKTILFVTHDLEEALYLADQVVVFSSKPTRTLQTLRLEQPRPRDVSADPALSKHAETLRSLFEAMDPDRGKAKEAVPRSATVGAFAKIMGSGKSGFADRIIADGVVLLAFVAWYLYAQVTPDFIMPNPVSVLRLTVDLFFSQKYMIHTYTSFVRVLLSVSLSLLIGGSIAFVGWYVRPLRLLVGNRVIPVLNAFPSLGWAILAVIWFGVNNFSVLFVEVAILLPFSMVNIWQGVKALDEETVEMSRSFTKSRKRIFARIMLPLLFPFIFSAIRVSYGVAWKVALIAELFGAEIGLGHLLNIASQNLNTTLVFAVILAMIVLVIGVERLVFDPLERRAQRHLVAAEESA